MVILVRNRLPEAIFRSGAPPSGRRPRLLTPLYGSLRRSFSGTTWHLAHAAMTAAVLDGAFTLNSDAKFNLRLQTAGALWKLRRKLAGQKFGGFKFVDTFNNLLWSQYMPDLAGSLIINNTQIYSEFFVDHYGHYDIIPCLYIDGTLSEYFLKYGQVEQQMMGADMVRKAIEMERSGYRHAARIIIMSRATAANLIDDYGVEPNGIAVVTPGANIDDEVVPDPSTHTGWVGNEFTLGFVGLFPLRKGLDKLAAAVTLLRRKGCPIRLRVIGRCPDDIAALDGVEFLGTIDKTDATAKFVAAIRTVDLGCQISRAELLGIAMLEFMRVGVPIIATNVGGMPDVLNDGGGILVPADITAERLADELESLMTDRKRYNALRHRAIERATWASWHRAAGEIDTALSGLG